VSEAQLGDLMRDYLFPSAFSDVKPGLESLEGIPLAILSNGTPEMLESAVRHNALESSFAEIISVDNVQIYKPSPRVYAVGVETLRRRAAEMLFVSSNCGMSQEQVLLVIWFAGATGPMPISSS
jgi:2-haloacid dehalogenase